MPARSDDPLRRVTLNLYESDCLALEARHGHGWTTHIRDLVHADVIRTIDTVNHFPRLTLGDLE